MLKISTEICIIIVASLVIGFLLGRWRIPDYCGDIIVSPESKECTFALGIPPDDIHLYKELVFRVKIKEKPV